MNLKPIDIARNLNISTSLLRHHEKLGIVPEPERTKSGYRVYTETHLEYFKCINKMNPGFGMKFTGEVMKKIMKEEISEAFWLINEVQYKLNQEKKMAEKTIKILGENKSEVTLNPEKKWLTIGEAAIEVGTTASAIRHWQSEGLINPKRDAESGYRVFYPDHIKKLHLIQMIKTSVWSLDEVRTMLDSMSGKDTNEISILANQSLKYINEKIKNQFLGIQALCELCTSLKVI